LPDDSESLALLIIYFGVKHYDNLATIIGINKLGVFMCFFIMMTGLIRKLNIIDITLKNLVQLTKLLLFNSTCTKLSCFSEKNSEFAEGYWDPYFIENLFSS
jgi:hypothetical protein